MSDPRHETPTEPPGPGRPSPRLDPFAFPSETSFRFLLLITAVLGVTLFAYNWLYNDLLLTDAEVELTIRCAQQQVADMSQAADSAALDAALERQAACIGDSNRAHAVVMIGGVAAVLALAVALYFAWPTWRIRRRRLEPLRVEDAPEVLETLAGLCAEAGLHGQPSWVFDPLDRTAGGVAFGHIGRRYVALTGGLVVVHATDPQRFRAIVLHELAHLRNRDIDITYLTLAVWLAFVAVALIPLGLSLASLVDDAVEWVVGFGWRLVALTVLAYLTRNAVLRARERYADVRASTQEPAIRSVLAAERSGETPPPMSGWRRYTSRLQVLALHPTRSDRVGTIDRPDRLFRTGALEAFGVGMATTVAYAEVVSLLAFLNLYGIQWMWLSAVLFAPFAAAFIAMGVWRQTFAELALGVRSSIALRLGLALGAGMLVGQRISLETAVSDTDAVLGPGTLGPDGVWALIVLGGSVLFVAWTAAAASLWVPAAATMRSVRPTAVAGMVAAAVVLTVALGTFVLLRNIRPVMEFIDLALGLDHARISETVWAGPVELWRVVQDPLAMVIFEQPVVWVLLVLVWAFPLAAHLWLRAGPRSVVPRWGALDGADGPPLARPRLHVRSAFAIGLLGGAAAFVLLVLIRLAAQALVPESTRGTTDFVLAFFHWSVCGTLLIQAAVAAWLGASGWKAATIHGLFAAFVAGVIAAVSLFSQPSIASCVPAIAIRETTDPCAWYADTTFMRLVLQQVVGFGFVVALVVGGLMSLLAGGVRRVVQPRQPDVAVVR